MDCAFLKICISTFLFFSLLAFEQNMLLERAYMKGHSKIYQGSYWGPFLRCICIFHVVWKANYCHVMGGLNVTAMQWIC